MATATQVQIRRSSAVVLGAATPVEGELGVDLTTFSLVIGDGVTLGGRRQASEAYVQSLIGALTAGNSVNIFNWQNNT